jgi:hypothetical protein
MSKRDQTRFVFTFGAAQLISTGQQTDSNLPVLIQIANPNTLFSGPSQSAILTSDNEFYLWGIIKQTNSDALLSLRRETNSNIVLSPTAILSSIQTVAIDDALIVALTLKNSVIDLSDDSKPWRSIPNIRSMFARYNTLILFDSDSYYFVRDHSKRPEPKILCKGELPLTAVISRNSFAILSDRSVLYIFPDNAKPLIIPDVVSAAASADRYVVLKPDGRVYEIMGNGSKRMIAGIEGNVVKVFAGGAHFGCVTLEGECWMWGCGGRGQLGNGRFTVAFVPGKVIVKDGFRVIDGVAGEEHSMVMTVKEEEFVPVLPERMKMNEYMRMVRLSNALPGAFVASELDAKF